jgi:microcystin degradation protein MlrC
MKYQLMYLLLGLTILSAGCNSQPRKLRILSCGIRHESNTFSTLPTTFSDFKILRGEAISNGQKWADYLKEEGIELIPTVHAYAWPGGVVEKQAYETIKNEILDQIRNAGELDGIYLDMHGALHVDGYADAQVDFIKEIRKIAGEKVIISGSFDLHGNVSDEFVSGLNVLTAYRTAPHRDEAETRLRAVKMLVKCIREKLSPRIECVTIPILVPGEKSITEVEPLNSIYAKLYTVEKSEGLLDASIFVGYAWADLPRSSMRVFVIAKDEMHARKAKQEAALIAQQIWDARSRLELDVESGSIQEMIKKAESLPPKTVFISDSGDNTTAGAPGDNPQVLKALIDAGCKNALVAGLVDLEAFNQCVKTGIGANVKLVVGGKKDHTFGFPLPLEGVVENLSPDSILATTKAVVLLKVKGIKVALLNSRRSFTTLKDFSDIGLNPLDFKIVVVKLGYLYPELRDIAPAHLIALTSGFCNLDIPSLPFKQAKRPIYPLDREMTWTAN